MALPATEPAIVRHNKHTPDIQALKHQYLDSLESISTLTTNLRTVVILLLELEVPRQQLVVWAMEAGFSEAYVRSVLSLIRVCAGARVRRPGAGRRIPPEALTILAYVSGHYGSRAGKLLLAAYRAFQSQTAVPPSPNQSSAGFSRVEIPIPQ